MAVLSNNAMQREAHSRYKLGYPEFCHLDKKIVSIKSIVQPTSERPSYIGRTVCSACSKTTCAKCSFAISYQKDYCNAVCSLKYQILPHQPCRQYWPFACIAAVGSMICPQSHLWSWRSTASLWALDCSGTSERTHCDNLKWGKNPGKFSSFELISCHKKWYF